MLVLDTALAALAALDGVAPVYARDGVVYDADSGKPYTDADLAALALPRQRADAARQVDAAAEAERSRLVTPGVGQAEEYRRAAEEAARLLGGETMDSPSLRADVDAGTVDPRTGSPVTSQAEAADLILWRRSQWEAALDAIRIERLRAKAEIAAAADGPALQAILDGLTWPGAATT